MLLLLLADAAGVLPVVVATNAGGYIGVIVVIFVVVAVAVCVCVCVCE